jgi:hypothetical protein
MVRGHEPPITPSAPQSSSRGTLETAKQSSLRPSDNPQPPTVRGTGDSGQPHSTRRRKSLPRHDFTPQQDLSEPRPSQPKSPAYLHGKNPYGQILENVDHPYRKPRTDGPPSQIESSIERRPRTTGGSSFTTRPLQSKSELPQLGARQPQKPISVQAAKNFFETKAAEHGTGTRFPPPATATITKGVTANSQDKDRLPQTVSQPRPKDEEARPAKHPSRTSEQIDVQREPKTTSPIPRPYSDATKRVDQPERTNPFKRQKPGSARPQFVIKSSTDSQNADNEIKSLRHGAQGHPVIKSPDDGLALGPSPDISEEVHRRRRSTNVFTEPKQSSRSFAYGRRVVNEPGKLDELPNVARSAVDEKGSLRSGRQLLLEEPVRRRSTRRSVPTAESDETAATVKPRRSTTQQDTTAGHDVPRAPTSGRTQTGSLNTKNERPGREVTEVLTVERRYAPAESFDSKATTKRTRRKGS